MTGQRLKESGYNYTCLISSTMTRARETADIIHKVLPDIPREETDILREGAPIPPEPPLGSWRPEKNVRIVDNKCVEVKSSMILLSIYSPNLMKGRQQTIVYL